MVNALDILFNALWVLGLAILLAVWSYARYNTQVKGIRVREKFNELNYALVLNVGLLLFLCGMALTEDRWLAKILWVLLAVAVIVESALRIQRNRKERKGSSGND